MGTATPPSYEPEMSEFFNNRHQRTLETGGSIASEPLHHWLAPTVSPDDKVEAAAIRDQHFRKLNAELRYSEEIDLTSTQLQPSALGDAITTLTLNLVPSRHSAEGCHQIHEAITKLDRSQGILSAGHQLAEQLQASYAKLSTSRALGSISALGSLGQWFQAINALDNTDVATPWQVHVLSHAVSILASKESQPLLRMALVAARISLNSADSIHNLSIATLTALGHAPRAQTSSDHLTSQRLDKLFSCDRVSNRELTLRRVSSDTVALCDKDTLQPLRYAKLDQAALKRAPKTPIPVMTARELLESQPGRGSSAKEKVSWLLRIEEQIIKPLTEHRIRRSETQEPRDRIESAVRQKWGHLLRKESWKRALARWNNALEDRGKFETLEKGSEAESAARKVSAFEARIKRHASSAASNDPLLSELLHQYELEPDIEKKSIIISSLLETPSLEDFCDWASEYDDHGDYELHGDVLMWHRHGNSSRSLEALVSRLDDDRWDSISSDLTRRLEALYSKIEPLVTRLETRDYMDIATDSSLLPFTSVNRHDNSDVVGIVKALDIPEARAILERNFCLDLSAIPRASQIQLFRFLAECTQQEFDSLRDCFQRHRRVAPLLARSMIAYAEKREAAFSLVSLAKKLPTHELTQTLEGFLRVSDAASASEDLVRARGLSVEQSRELIERVRVRTLERANRLLESWGRMLRSESDGSASSQHGFIKLASQLEGDSVIFAALFREALSKDAATLEKLKEVNVSQCDGETLSAQDRLHMKTIHDYNGAQLYPSQFGGIVNNAFEASLQDPHSRFYLLRINGKIEGFARFVDEKPGRKYCGSFNVSPALESFGLGGRFLEEMLAHEGKDCQIRLLVSDNNPFKGAYQNKYGFQLTASTQDCDLGEALDSPSGVTVHEMVRHPEQIQNS